VESILAEPIHSTVLVRTQAGTQGEGITRQNLDLILRLVRGLELLGTRSKKSSP